MELRLLLVCAWCVVGCARRSEEPPPITKEVVAKQAPAKDAAPPVTRPTWPADAPNPQAPCKSHDECAVLMEAPGSDPCCTHRAFQPVSRAYADFAQRFHEEKCKGVVCPAQPLPGPEPNCCVSIGRCVNSKCIGGCDDPTLKAPDVTWLDSMCRMPRP